MKKTQILMNKLVNLGLSILDLSKTVMHEFLYNYAKPKYGENAKLCYIDTDSFSSVKWSNPGHSLKSQGKFIFSFPCTLFLHIFDT